MLAKRVTDEFVDAALLTLRQIVAVLCRRQFQIDQFIF